MKKLVFGLLCLLLLLNGCQTGPQTPTQPPTQAPTQEPTQATDLPALPLLEQGTAEGPNLLHIPTDALADMASPELRLLGNGLLITDYVKNRLVLRHISLEDGALLAERAIPAGPGVTLRIGSGVIALVDPGIGRLTVLDQQLQTEKTLEVEGEQLYLSQELDTLYSFCPQRGILATQLETGAQSWILDNAQLLRVLGPDTGYVLFRYTDRDTQRTHSLCLNLYTGTMETLPADGVFQWGLRRGSTWLLKGEQYLLCDGTGVRSFSLGEGSASFLAPRNQLLVTDGSGRQLTLYDTQGQFLSQCTLPEGNLTGVSGEPVWSGYWEGYFFTDTVDNLPRLMFWDPAVPTQGEALPLEPVDRQQPVEPVMEPALYEKARALSRQYGLDIRIAEECQADYSHYDSEPLTEPFYVREALDILESCLEVYPEGFLEQLLYGPFDSIRLELVGLLTTKADRNSHPAAVNGFVQEVDNTLLVVLSGYYVEAETVYHEFSHLIDRRLAWDATLREGALFGEEAWLALQPEGFDYAYSYVDIPQSLQAFQESRYFTGNYAMTYPTEDRATLMAATMVQSPILEHSPGMQEKMRYYARCIRDCFDTENWPEVTAWEVIPE